MLRADAATIDPLRSAVHDYAGHVALPEEAWTGRKLGAYSIERQVGAGGMGRVFLGRRDDAQYDRLVAIKVLASPFASREEHLRFLAERQILANFAHPNIAQLFDGGAMEDGRPYLVMEHDGGKVALAVDRLLGQEEVVLKALSRPLDLVTGLSGVTILGSGRPVFILDVPRLVAA